MESRPFDAKQDFGRLQAFLAEMRQQVSQAAYYQFGDLLWRIHYASNAFDPATDLRIWQYEDASIAGFAHYQASDDNPEFLLRPELYDSRLADEMVAWVVARAKAGGASAIEASCIEGDARKEAFLAHAGFCPLDDDPMVFMACRLADALPDPNLADGYEFATAAERPDLATVTGTPYSPAAYATMVQSYGYRDELGLRVVHEDEVVAGCIAWYDAVDRCGEFEPVGTVASHRGRGLAYAVMAQVMAHLKRAGAEMV